MLLHTIEIQLLDWTIRYLKEYLGSKSENCNQFMHKSAVRIRKTFPIVH